MAHLQLTSLPVELIIKIFEYLDIRTLLGAQQTCHTLKAIVDDCISLQYAIELAASGMSDGMDPRFATVQRLESLKAYDKAWKELSWTDLSDREFGSTDGLHHVSGSVLATVVDNDARTLSLERVPSLLRGIQHDQWELKFDSAIIDFYMDSAQDLLIIITAANWPFNLEIKLLSLSSGLPHPSSAPGEIKLHGARPDIHTGEICGDYFGLGMQATSVSNQRRALVIWNWKTGMKESQSDLPRAYPTRIEFPSFTFLDDSHIMILAYRADGPFNSVEEIQLQTYRFRTPNGEFSPLRDFILPELQERTQIMILRFCPNHAPRRSSGLQRMGLYYHDPKDRLFVICLMVTGGGCHESFELRFPAQTILSHLQSGDMSPVLWKAWGPSMSHFTRHTGPFRPQRWAVYGMKTVQWKNIMLEDCVKQILVVFDYHPRRVARSAIHSGDQVLSSGDSPSMVSIGDTIDGRLLKEQVKTSVTYLYKEIPIPNTCPGEIVQVELCDDGLILYMRVLGQSWMRETRVISL
ncbi:hypothetical protein BV25DRAFT_1987767 [Artomyces pyxidatus]|uniref:Uncharacterized protein n=1 Tax=Artomyces pyxidatus TaxID=48021 RepID=A0ACB8TG42_9AGAM|nr:hypothetical protein BV25DRAFT_1987767 [Artomyces pyxidatus]